MVKLLEPIMLLVMAGVTLLVVAGLLLPVFKMGGAVSGCNRPAPRSGRDSLQGQ